MTAAVQPAAVLDGGAAHTAPDGALCRRYDLALLDLDGVVYRGPEPVPAAAAALATARAAQMRLAFVTNNASRSPEQIVGQLATLGIPAGTDEVVTSAQAAATLAAERLGPGARVFVVGGDGLRQALTSAGLVLVDRYDAVPPPEAVVQGFSPDLTYEDLAQAALAVSAGADWVATNTDTTLPTARGLQPGNGTLVAAVAAASGKRPVVAGKPERALVDEAVRRLGGDRPLVVGDRLDTDIEGAVRAGLDSLLVLTGVSTVADLLVSFATSRPTYLSVDLAGLAEVGVPLTAEGVAGTRWRAVVDGTVLSLHPAWEADEAGYRDEDALEAVRVLAVACWQASDAGAPITSVRAEPALALRLSELGVPASMLASAAQQQAPAGSGSAEAGSSEGSD